MTESEQEYKLCINCALNSLHATNHMLDQHGISIQNKNYLKLYEETIGWKSYICTVCGFIEFFGIKKENE